MTPLDMQFAIAYAAARLKFYDFEMAQHFDPMTRTNMFSATLDGEPKVLYRSTRYGEMDQWHTYPVTGATVGEFIDGFNTMLRMKYPDRELQQYVSTDKIVGMMPPSNPVNATPGAHTHSIQNLPAHGVAVGVGALPLAGQFYATGNEVDFSHGQVLTVGKSTP